MSDNKSKRIIITGATGFIGRHLYMKLADNHDILIFTRSIKKAKELLGDNLQAVYWDGKSIDNIVEYLEGAYGIINLAGENIGHKRWTKKQKENIINSRVSLTAALSRAVKNTKDKPEVFIQASATGYYGFDSEKTYDEMISVKAPGFLAEVVRKWEKAVDTADSHTRFIIARFGVVLSKDGGILKKIVVPFRFYMGGYPGNGKQWISWIHIDDAINAISFLLENNKSSGIYNITSPHPVQYMTLADKIARFINRPSWLPVPKFILSLLYGQRTKELLLSGIRAYPKKLTDEQFKFLYVNIEEALKNIFKLSKTK